MVRIEQLQSHEGTRYRAVRLSALKDAPDAFGLTYEDTLQNPPQEWRAKLEERDAVTFVASQNGTDVGLICCQKHDIYPGAVLYSMWVAPSARGQGVGEALIQAVIDWARKRGFGALRLGVGHLNLPAQNLYERMGFIATGESDAFPPPRTHITMYVMILELND